MILNFTIPTNQAHLEIFFTLPVGGSSVPSASVSMQGQAHSAYFGSVSTINSISTYSGRVILTSPSPETPLSSHIGSTVSVDLQGIITEGTTRIKAFAQTNRREITSLTVTTSGG